MDLLSKKLALYIMHNNKRLLDYEVIKYGADAIVSTFFCLTLAIAVASLLGCFQFSLFFILFLTPIKMSFKGYHCKTLFSCALTYGGSIACFSIIYKLLNFYNISIPFPLFLISMLLISVLVRNELTKRTILYIIIYWFIGVFFYLLYVDLYIIFCLSCLFEMILLILLLQNNCKNKQNHHSAI